MFEPWPLERDLGMNIQREICLPQIEYLIDTKQYSLVRRDWGCKSRDLVRRGCGGRSIIQGGNYRKALSRGVVWEGGIGRGAGGKFTSTEQLERFTAEILLPRHPGL